MLNTESKVKQRKIMGLIPISKVPFQEVHRDLRILDKQLRIGEDIPFLNMFEDDSTIITKSNSLIQILRIKGMSILSSSREEEKQMLNEKKHFLQSLDDRFSYSFLYFHRRNQKEFSQKPSKDQITNEILQKWEDGFSDIFQTEIYLVITNQAKSPQNVILTAKTKEDLIERYVSLSNHTLNLIETAKIFKAQKCKGDNLLKVYDYILNPYDEELKKHIFKYKQSANLSVVYGRSDIEYRNNGLMIFKSDLHKKYSKILSIKSFPQETTLEMLDSLFKEKIEFLIVNNIFPCTEEQARSRILKTLDRIRITPFVTDEKEEDALKATKALGEGKESFYDYDFSIQIYANSESELNNHLARIEGQLQRKGIICITEETGIRVKYISFFPDTFKLKAPDKAPSKSFRSELISVSNISDMISLSSSSKGLITCPFGDSPVVHIKTTKGTDYAFTFHIDESAEPQGNTLIIGTTGYGKSMITSFLLMNALNQFPKLKILGFDSKLGLKTPTSFFGGKHIRYGQKEGLGLNPFQLDDTYENKEFLRCFISMLADGIEESEKDIVVDAIRNSFRASKNNRSLAMSMETNLFLDDEEHRSSRRSPIHERLKQWVPDDENSKLHGMLFNAKEDVLDFKNRWVVYDMESALNSEVLYPIASYIFHKFRTEVEPEGTPHIVLIDEMASYLRNKEFTKYILKHVSEARKKKGMFLGLMQSLSNITGEDSKNSDGKTIIENTGTFILFPNERMKKEDGDLLNLSENEYDWIRNSKEKRKVLVKKQHQEAVILDIDLMCLGKYKTAFSSDSEVLNRLHEVMNEEDWRNELLKGWDA